MLSDPFRGVLSFVRVAEARSFRRAAESLGVTTAAVSKSVRTLEEELGVTLLQRSTRTVTLTTDGERFFAHCRGALASVSAARDEARGARKAPHGEVTLSCPSVLAPYVAQALARLRERHPRLVFRVEVSDRIARLADERVDVAVRLGPLESSSLVARKLAKPRWSIVGSPAYLARKGAVVRIEDLAGHDAIVFRGPNGKPRPFELRKPLERVTPEAVLEVDHGPMLLDAALAGLGLCQVLDFMAEPLVRDGRLVEVLAAHAAVGPEIHAVCAPGRRSSATIKAVFDALADAFRSD